MRGGFEFLGLFRLQRFSIKRWQLWFLQFLRGLARSTELVGAGARTSQPLGLSPSKPGRVLV